MPDKGWLAVGAKRMDVALANLSPVLKPNGELEGRGGFAHEFLFIQTQQSIECTHGGDC